MKTKFTKTLVLFFVSSLLFSFQSIAQTYNNFDYECLEAPLVFYFPNQGYTHTNCTDGVMSIDTLDNPCYDFYEEDKNLLKAWFYVETNPNNTNINLYFDSMRMHHDNNFDGELTKYFEFNRACFWYTFREPGNTIQKLTFRVQDLSGGGVNFGTDFGAGPDYYTDFDALVAQGVDGLIMDYTDNLLTIEGDSLRNIYIGGDHIYIANVDINEQVVTNLSSLEQIDLQLYPNPSTDQINIEGNILNGSTVQLIDINGRVLLSEKVASEKWQGNISTFPSGVFWVNVLNQKQTIWSRTIIKK